MSAILKPMVAVLFDHELRAAAEACHHLNGLLKEKADAETKASALDAAWRLSYVALAAITDKVQAITVVALRDALPVDSAAENQERNKT